MSNEARARELAAQNQSLFNYVEFLTNAQRELAVPAAEEARLGLFLTAGQPGSYEGVGTYTTADALKGFGLFPGSDVGRYTSTQAADVTKLQHMWHPSFGKRFETLLRGGKNAKDPTSTVISDPNERVRLLKEFIDNNIPGVSSSQFSAKALRDFAMNPVGRMAPGATDVGRLAQQGFFSKIAGAHIPVLDREAVLKGFHASTAGKTVNKLMVVSKQLLDRSGPLWDSISQSVLNPIIEGAAQVTRESAEEIRRMFARGGSARQSAVATILNIRNIENNNRNARQSLSLANLALNQWAIDNAKSSVNFLQGVIDNIGGVRDTFNQTMTAMTNFYGTTLLPAAQSMAQLNYILTYKKKKNTLGLVLTGVLAIGGAIVGSLTGIGAQTGAQLGLLAAKGLGLSEDEGFNQEQLAALGDFGGKTAGFIKQGVTNVYNNLFDPGQPFGKKLTPLTPDITQGGLGATPGGSLGLFNLGGTPSIG